MIDKTHIKELFKNQLEKISNPKLKEQVIEAWVMGCRRGHWNSLEELRQIPFTLLTDTRGINFIEHTIAVTEGAYALAKAQTENYRTMPYAIDFDRLVAGGLLHDVGKLLEIEKTADNSYRKSKNGKCYRHPISGAILAAEAGCDDELINTIACHAKEGDGRPQVIETVFIHQADFATFDPLVMLKNNQLIVE
jgi:putative nucleotidyltransferase with HDIG domain